MPISEPTEWEGSMVIVPKKYRKLLIGLDLKDLQIKF